MLGSFATCPKRQSTRCSEKKEKKKKSRVSHFELLCVLLEGLGTPPFTCKTE